MIHRKRTSQGFVGSRGLAWVLVCLLVLCAFVGAASGQSGRRAQRPGEATPAPSTVEPKEEPNVASVNPVETAKLSLFVVDHFSSEEIPANVVREIVQSFYGRLRERSTAVAVTLERDLSRKEAVEHAKKVMRTYVVWLEVQTDAPEAERASGEPGDDDALAVTYVVFTPGTAEIKTEGRVYYQHLNERAQSGGGNRKRKRPRPVRLPSEETLEGVGRAAADRVLAAFKEMLPPS
jgi:hypothetical protein